MPWEKKGQRKVLVLFIIGLVYYFMVISPLRSIYGTSSPTTTTTATHAQFMHGIEFEWFPSLNDPGLDTDTIYSNGFHLNKEQEEQQQKKKIVNI